MILLEYFIFGGPTIHQEASRRVREASLLRKEISLEYPGDVNTVKRGTLFTSYWSLLLGGGSHIEEGLLRKEFGGEGARGGGGRSLTGIGCQEWYLVGIGGPKTKEALIYLTPFSLRIWRENADPS